MCILDPVLKARGRNIGPQSWLDQFMIDYVGR